MSSFPPFPPNGGRYSPSNAYGQAPPFPPYATSGPPPSFPPFDAYNNEPSRAPFAYEQPSRPYSSDVYDPYQPASATASAYSPGAPQIPFSSSSYQPSHTMPPANIPRNNNVPPPAAPLMRMGQVDHGELTLLTEATSVSLAGEDIKVHSLPPSHLPIDKYIATNASDALSVHRQLCRNASSIWYADGSSRAGEGWSAAIEWIIDSSRSGSKMRGCVGMADALDAELGGLCKAVEGFQELLHQSLKDGKPMSHELIVFSDSQAAIVAIDTSSRPEALRFERLWRDICSEFLTAHLRLAWLPKGTNIEGHVLADKIATVGASNSYLKRKKENTLPEVYRRPNGGEPAPGGSTEAGPWQRGDADPSRRKSPFERPKPLILSPPKEHGLRLETGPAQQALSDSGVEEDYPASKPDSIFVTHFPDQISAKDIGILFGQYGNIVSVDIFHISPELPRFATVAYSDPASGLAAIEDLNRRPINLDSEFGRANWDDLQVWNQWQGQLTIVRSEPGRLVPQAIAHDFPNLPEWAAGNSKEKTDEREVDQQISGAVPSPANSKKRERTVDERASSTPTLDASPQNKKPRSLPPNDHPSAISVKLEPGLANPQPNAADPAHPAHLPPFPPTHGVQSSHIPYAHPANHASPSISHQGKVVLPPTPNTAQSSGHAQAPVRQDSAEPSANGQGRRPLTNSASEPQEYPIKVGAKTIRAQINLVKRSFGKVHASNWIAHSCFLASEIDQARRALQDDLYATDTGFLAGRDLEKRLSDKGFTAQRMDAFITKVLKVLDNIASAEEDEAGNGDDQDDVATLETELAAALEPYPDQTKEAIDSASRLMEYLLRGKEAQERKRLEVERRVKVLEGMDRVGEVVGGVVRYLLSEDK